MVTPEQSLIETMVTYPNGETLPEPLALIRETLGAENLAGRLYADRAANIYCAHPRHTAAVRRVTPYTRDMIYELMAQATGDGTWELCDDRVLSPDAFSFFTRVNGKYIVEAAELARLDCEAD